MKLAIAGLILVCAALASAQKLTVKILNRQDNDTVYTYVVPGQFSSQSNSNVNCNGDVPRVQACLPTRCHITCAEPHSP
jgi:hypothetical protein